jgi:hypothetical protein
MYHILNPYKTSWGEIILKSAFESSYRFKTTIHNSTSKVYYYIFYVYLLDFNIFYIFLFELAILTHKKISTSIILPYILWHLNKVNFVKNPMYAKSESPYLASTLYNMVKKSKKCRWIRQRLVWMQVHNHGSWVC